MGEFNLQDAIQLHGTQVIPNPENSRESVTVHAFMLLQRLPANNTDILITLTDPNPEPSVLHVKQAFDLMCAHLQIVDWNLFA